MVKISNLTGGYKGVKIFDSLSLEVQKGSFTALLGPNGSGKSTLFKFLLKALAPDSGLIEINGQDISELSQIKLARVLSFIPQYYLIPEGFTVRQIISMADFAKRTCSDSQINDALELAGISHLSERMASELSGGEAQLVMLCRAVCCQTDLILMDEPTSNLDISKQSQLLRITKKLCYENGKTVFCSMHDLNCASTYADFCHVLSGGKLYSSGRPEDVINASMLDEVFHSDARMVYDPGTDRKIILA